MPKKVLRRLNLRTLRISTASFIDEELSEHFADLVFHCQNKHHRPVACCFLLEHKSFVPPLCSFPATQVHDQSLGHWIKENREPIVIMPIVFYHGKEPWDHRPWKDFLPGMEEVFEPFTPAWKYLFIELTGLSDEEIRQFQDNFLKVSLFLMKYRYQKELILKILDDIANFVEHFRHEDDQIIILKYIFSVDVINMNTAREKFAKFTKIKKVMTSIEKLREEFQDIIIKELREEAMQAAREEVREELREEMRGKFKELWMQQGMHQGMQQGIDLGIQMLIQQIIKNNPALTDEEIAGMCGVSVHVIQQGQGQCRQREW